MRIRAFFACLAIVVGLAACGNEPNLIVGEPADAAGVQGEAVSDPAVEEQHLLGGSVWSIVWIQDSKLTDNFPGLTFWNTDDGLRFEVSNSCSFGSGLADEGFNTFTVTRSTFTSTCETVNLGPLFEFGTTVTHHFEVDGSLLLGGNGMVATAHHVQSTSMHELPGLGEDSPTTTAPPPIPTPQRGELLEDHPLLNALSANSYQGFGGLLGRSIFLVKDAAGVVVDPEHEDADATVAVLVAYLEGADQVTYILMLADVGLDDSGLPDDPCTGLVAGQLVDVGGGDFIFTDGLFPAVASQEYQDAAECADGPASKFGRLLSGQFAIEVTTDGMVLRNADGDTGILQHILQPEDPPVTDSIGAPTESPATTAHG